MLVGCVVTVETHDALSIMIAIIDVDTSSQCLARDLHVQVAKRN
jgi:carbamate kinase